MNYLLYHIRSIDTLPMYQFNEVYESFSAYPWSLPLVACLSSFLIFLLAIRRK